jgi:hypothetical protein
MADGIRRSRRWAPPLSAAVANAGRRHTPGGPSHTPFGTAHPMAAARAWFFLRDCIIASAPCARSLVFLESLNMRVATRADPSRLSQMRLGTVMGLGLSAPTKFNLSRTHRRQHICQHGRGASICQNNRQTSPAPVSASHYPLSLTCRPRASPGQERRSAVHAISTAGFRVFTEKLLVTRCTTAQQSLLVVLHRCNETQDPSTFFGVFATPQFPGTGTLYCVLIARTQGPGAFYVIDLVLFLQKQNLAASCSPLFINGRTVSSVATVIYLFGLGTLLTGLGLKHMRIRSHHDLAGALVTSLLLGRPWWSTTSPTCLPLSVFTITSDQHLCRIPPLL